MNPTHYEILGVARDCDGEAIKDAYRLIAKQYHPDQNPKGRRVFEAAKAAYDVLNDPQKRFAYDRKLGIPEAAPAFAIAGFAERRK